MHQRRSFGMMCFCASLLAIVVNKSDASAHLQYGRVPTTEGSPESLHIAYEGALRFFHHDDEKKGEKQDVLLQEGPSNYTFQDNDIGAPDDDSGFGEEEEEDQEIDIVENPRKLQGSSCTPVVIDFETAGDGKNLNGGEYVKDEWKLGYGLTITARGRGGGYTPDDKPRLFDSANPGDYRQLGSPNTRCTRRGPGSGSGGWPGADGENCDPLGLVLIIQDSDTTYGKDYPRGGSIYFAFDEPTAVTSIGLLDINTSAAKIYVTGANGRRTLIRIPRRGNNSAQTVDINMSGVVRLEVNLRNFGAITHLAFCPSMTLAPTPRPTQRPTARGNCIPTQRIVDEDFEDGSLAGWSNGKIDYDPGFTKFLGRFVKDDPDPVKEYPVNPGALTVTVEFDFYEIDSWNSDTRYGPDCIYVYINGEKLDIGIFSSKRDEGLRRGKTPKSIEWVSQSQGPPRHIGFQSGRDFFVDQIHHISATVPRRLYEDTGKIVLRLNTQVTATRVTDESAGYDNIRITERHDCSGTSRPTPAPTPAGPCTDVVNIDFETSGDGTALNRGDYVGDNWKDNFGFVITAFAACSGFTPDAKARIFDTANPGTSQADGDPDLGSPNKQCDEPGPGVGVFGRPGFAGENCVPQGNVLVIQESDKDAPDDNRNGGVLCFEATGSPLEVQSIGLMGIPSGPHYFLEVFVEGQALPERIAIDGLGTNAVQDVPVNLKRVTSFCLFLPGEGAVTNLSMCKRPPVSGRQCDPTVVVHEEDFENESLVGWKNGKIDSDPGFTKFLGRFVKNSPDPYKSFTVPTNAESVLVEFDFYEIDSWNSDNRYGPDNISVLIDNDLLEIGVFNSKTDEGFRHGTSPNGIRWESRSQGPPRHIGFQNGGLDRMVDQIHHIAALVPSFFFRADGRITLRFVTDVTASSLRDESSGFDNIKLTANFDCSTPETESVRKLFVPENSVVKDPQQAQQQHSNNESNTAQQTSKVVGAVPDEEESLEGLDCEKASRISDISEISMEKCVAALEVNPITIVSQDGDTVTFTVSQLWKGCGDATTTPVSWLAADYVGVEGELVCARRDNAACGEIGTYTSRCEEGGVSVIDLYAYDGEGSAFRSVDEKVFVPLACDAMGETEKMCHFRYLLRCSPSLCENESRESAAMNRDSTSRKLRG